MHKNWTINCHHCGNNHAKIRAHEADTERGYQFVVFCTDEECGFSENVTDIVSED